MHGQSTPDRPEQTRIAGVELARAVAIIGMLSVHFGPYPAHTLFEKIFTLASGRASILFVLMAGIGVSLLAGSHRVSPMDARLRLAWRALVLLPLGLALQELDTTVRVILPSYALLFLVGIWALGLRDRALLLLAAGFVLAGPVLFLRGYLQAPLIFDRNPVTLSDSMGQIIHSLVLSGPYPLITWAAPFLLGLWLGRRDLRSDATRTALVVGGATVAMAAAVTALVLNAVFESGPYPMGWARLMIDTPHSQMPLWLVGSMGAASMMLGLSLTAADLLQRLAWPLVALGQLSLTVYIAHLLLLHWWPSVFLSADAGKAMGVLLGVTLAATVFALAWRQAFPRGPVESLLHLPWQLARHARLIKS